jgi:hypothetical protein
MFLPVNIETMNQKNENVLFNMNFANLKNLQYQLNQALKMHNNAKIKVAKNSSV